MNGSLFPESLCSLKQTAARLGLAESTVRKLVRLKSLPAVKIGRRLLFEPEELRRFIQSHRTAAAHESSGRATSDDAVGVAMTCNDWGNARALLNTNSERNNYDQARG